MIGIMETKVCSKCKTEYPATTDYFYRHKSEKSGLHSWCKKCRDKCNKHVRFKYKEYQRQYNKRYYAGRQDELRDSRRENRLKYIFDMTTKQYNQMLAAQNGVCAICGLPEERKRKGRILNLSVDHNHKTDKIRGLLCSKCNTGIGMLNVDNQGIELLCSAISYIRNTDGVKDELSKV